MRNPVYVQELFSISPLGRARLQPSLNAASECYLALKRRNMVKCLSWQCLFNCLHRLRSASWWCSFIADMDRSSAATLDAYPADPDSFAPESYADRDLERAAVAASAGAFSSMVEPSLLAASECGNMYAGESLVPQSA